MGMLKTSYIFDVFFIAKVQSILICGNRQISGLYFVHKMELVNLLIKIQFSEFEFNLSSSSSSSFLFIY